MIRPPQPVILYEDNHVIAIGKPAGMLSQADLSGDLDVLTFVKAFIKRRDGKPGNVFLGLVHRLDRPVAGAMILAKTSKAASRLSAQLRERSARKIYRAVVEGTPEPGQAELIHRLDRDRAARLTRVVAEGGKEARLSYRVLESAGSRSLVEVDLGTGLPHQIRAQLAAVGHPIVGDRKYGSAEALAGGPGRIALYSRSITFAHPVSREPVSVTADPPAGWPWG
jgi:23S rRNA pseudouridine1911/1915/1917 synthase